MSNAYLDNYNRWLASDKLTDEERAELLSIREMKMRFVSASPAIFPLAQQVCAAQ
jgi:hypothetical protein